MRNIFWLIIILGFFLLTRILFISSNPPSIYWDEASIGYNAFSILQDGKDEWGEFLPLHFKAFGEYKLPVYIYTTALFVKIFGLNELSIRLPAVLFSLGTVILVFLIILKLTNNYSIGLLSSFFLVISQWFFIFSRAGYEVSAGIMFYLLGAYLIRLSIKRNTFIFLATLSFILSMYSYNSFRIITLLTIFFLLVYFVKKKQVHLSHLKVIVASIILFLFSLIPIIFLNTTSTSRLQTVSLFYSNSGIVDFIFKFTSNYLSHFDPEFLFFSGDQNLRSQISNFGQLQIFQVPLIFFGLISLIKSRKKYSLILFFLLLISPIPAALTKESPHALRSIMLAPFYAIVSAFGAIFIKDLLKSKLIFLAIVVFSTVFFGIYFNSFLSKYPQESSESWQYGYKQIFQNYQSFFGKYDQIFISDRYGQPYIFVLYFLEIPPENFRKSVSYYPPSEWGFSLVKSFDKFRFGHIPDEEQKNIKTLYFLDSAADVVNLYRIGEINNLDESAAFKVYEN